MANWNYALIAELVYEKFNRGLPANLVPEGDLNSGLKGMQLSATSLACAVRQMAGPSSIHSLPTEQYNQDVVSLGMHDAVTALDALTLPVRPDCHGAARRRPGSRAARRAGRPGASFPARS